MEDTFPDGSRRKTSSPLPVLICVLNVPLTRDERNQCKCVQKVTVTTPATGVLGRNAATRRTPFAECRPVGRVAVRRRATARTARGRAAVSAGRPLPRSNADTFVVRRGGCPGLSERTRRDALLPTLRGQTGRVV